MATASALSAARVRQDVIMLKAWIEHWKLDSRMGIASTKGSLENAHFIAIRAIKELEEMERS